MPSDDKQGAACLAADRRTGNICSKNATGNAGKVQRTVIFVEMMNQTKIQGASHRNIFY
jgi:hypothetical protein